MNRNETLSSRFGEFIDLIRCDAIYNGAAEPKKKLKTWTFDDVMELR